MRNPDRIDIICGLLAEVWKKYPDLRLGQLLEDKAVFRTVIINGVFRAMVAFAQEDDETERKLRELL